MDRMPSLFVSHGSPTFAIDHAPAAQVLERLGRRLPRPKAVLVMSPHWMTRGVRVASTAAPETIHDFSGFPEELYRIRYPAPGAPDVARRAVALLREAGWDAAEDAQWGMDHGAWVPLRFLFPEADVPVVQVSMPHDLDADGATRLGRALAPLAAEGVLVVGSGSITHNLRDFRRDAPQDAAAAYAVEFVGWVRQAVSSHDGAALVDYRARAPHAQRAHPTAEHYLPLPFAFGAAPPGAPVEVVDGGMTYGVLAMDAYLFGADRAAAG